MQRMHYWKKAGPSAAPSNILVFDTETYHGDNVYDGEFERQTLRLGVSLAYRLEKGKRTRIDRITFTDAARFKDFVHSRLDKCRPLWVFAHNIAYDMGIVGGWEILQREGFSVGKCCLDGSTFFIKGEWDGCAIWFQDTFNYYRTSLDSIGRSIGFPKLVMPKHTDDNESWERYCDNDVQVTAAAVDNLIAFGKEEGFGPWQPTVAGQSFACYRSKFMKHKVLVHRYKPAIEVERDSYFGGIVDTNFIGTVKNVTELDVCSMYPWACTQPLPYRVKHFDYNVPIYRLKSLAEKYMLFADVSLKTEDYQYPVRIKKKVYYPIGEYRTCLAHPELMIALERGHIQHCHFASWHLHAPIFKEYMERFVYLKEHFKEEEHRNEGFSNVAKMLNTNLYGKCGQQSPIWQEWNEATFRIIAEENGLPYSEFANIAKNPPKLYDFEETISFPEWEIFLDVRNYWGKTEIRCGNRESRDSVPAIAACVTSYARVLLRHLQSVCGVRNWYYSDTDSLWVNQIGFSILQTAGCVGDGEAGKLSNKGCYDEVSFNGPKDYQGGDRYKLKGIKRPQETGCYFTEGICPQTGKRIRTVNVNGDRGGYLQLQFPSAKQQLRMGTNGVVLVKRLVKELNRRLDRCHLLPDGWTRPFRFPEDLPKGDRQ